MVSNKQLSILIGLFVGLFFLADKELKIANAEHQTVFQEYIGSHSSNKFLILGR